MKIAGLNFVKHNVASVLLTASAIVSVTAATEAMSVPFTVNAIIHEETGPGRPGCSTPFGFGGTITGTGTSSLFGRVSVEGNDCITPQEKGFSFEGKMTFTVLGGDQIFADYEGMFTPTGIQSIFAFTGSTFDITGGTGNFLHADGYGRLQGGEDISTGWGVLRATGTITDFIRDQDHKGKNKDHKDNDRKDSGPGRNNVSVTDGLDSSLFPSGQQTLGDYFYQDQNGRLLAINALPESGSLALLGIGLAGLMAIRRRKPANSAY
ncbi:PEP-CTERM protein-sorting domain-containing protein [Nitrosospira sp. Nl5]|uniref:PEP-CTERM sorting domain-containing protein n=1 Tax=Nitrosospira sp. Nl5 TaxID=200120 RepID=UPI00088ED03C|nr:PEP-CTERM sorting domain-containing protein [Nitrosospira sp. Nl5]SCY08038.1 PEP-CTERM protein-sorting domain-containing protein [Nitrosospira sp. Nl5]